ncbi:MAG: hypothetical protein RBT65_05625 [Methanolobus sp.]|nr:hypothetical protein [Methanolobus sp.]
MNDVSGCTDILLENIKYVVKLNDNIIDLSKLSILLADGDTISIERIVPDNKLEMFWKMETM